ncbi:hypothetical protein [Providencia hangzhouensis]|uniref:hypothetical protein n=1 Tax=Providencia hangzhouensis TaxID=3031799 RepID=UPI0034DCD791
MGIPNLYDASEYAQRIQQYFEFPHGLLSESKVWRQALSQAAEHLKHQLPLFDEALSNGCWRLVAEQARLCLMLGDHNYSSGGRPNMAIKYGVICQYQRVNGQTAYKQRLDEHLVNVANIAANITGTCHSLS